MASLIAAGLLLGSANLAFCEASGVAVAELAAQLQSAKKPQILDLRGAGIHRMGTVPGAIYVGTDPKGYLPTASDRPVVLLLPDPPDPDYLAAWARRLESAGLSVRWLVGGMPAWRLAGKPVEVPEYQYSKPGAVPFVIPRGQCEMGEPAQIFK